jgi:hypothetical protein
MRLHSTEMEVRIDRFMHLRFLLSCNQHVGKANGFFVGYINKSLPN